MRFITASSKAPSDSLKQSRTATNPKADSHNNPDCSVEHYDFPLAPPYGEELGRLKATTTPSAARKRADRYRNWVQQTAANPGGYYCGPIRFICRRAGMERNSAD